MSIWEDDAKLKAISEAFTISKIDSFAKIPLLDGKRAAAIHVDTLLAEGSDFIDRGKAEEGRQKYVVELLSSQGGKRLLDVAAAWSSLQEHERLRRDIAISAAGHKRRMLAHMKTAIHRYDQMKIEVKDKNK